VVKWQESACAADLPASYKLCDGKQKRFSNCSKAKTPSAIAGSIYILAETP
jgi:hypothetical protein